MAALIAAVIGARAEAAPAEVALVAAPGVRLADELARELAASSLAVARIEVPSRAAEAEALAATPAALRQGVFVAPDERVVTVFARTSTRDGLHTRIELRVDSHDRVGRRRACLTVVEYLRVLTSSAPASDAHARPVVVSPVASPVASPDPRNATDNSFPAASPAAAEVADARPSTVVLAPGVGQPQGARRPWIMGVATTLDLNTALGESTGRLSFIWHFAIRPRLALRVLALWPLVGAQFTADEGRIRMWTFGGAAGVQYGLVAPPANARSFVRPFVGFTLGTRLTLIETSSAAYPSSSPRFTPSVGVGVQAGLAYQVSRLVQLFVESGVTRDWLLPTVERQGVARDAASALSLNSSVGVMLEY